jgi:hypothetical protein
MEINDFKKLVKQYTLGRSLFRSRVEFNPVVVAQDPNYIDYIQSQLFQMLAKELNKTVGKRGVSINGSKENLNEYDKAFLTHG